MFDEQSTQNPGNENLLNASSFYKEPEMRDPAVDILRWWGKTDPFEPLLHHLVNVGCVGWILLEETPYRSIVDFLAKKLACARDELVRWLVFLLSLHDTMKATMQFQHQNGCVQTELNIILQRMKLLPTSADIAFLDHAASLWRWLAPILRKEYGLDKISSRVYAQALALHHYRIQNDNHQFLDPNAPEYGERDGHLESYWQGARQVLLKQMTTLFLGGACEKAPIVGKESADAVGVLLSGLLILSDWIASNTELMPVSAATLSVVDYHAIAMEKARRAVRTLGFTNILKGELDKDFDAVWPSFRPGGYTMRPIQQACEALMKEKQLPPGLLIVEAPMGEGKTEVALYVAQLWQQMAMRTGLYVALPTSATSNQMHGRVIRFLDGLGHDGTNVRLVHGMAWLMEENGESGWREELDETANKTATDLHVEQVAAQWFHPLRRALLSPYGVGTVDQPMQAALFSKYGVLRLLGLFGKVLVIDEVHAYDVYMTTILERLMAWCGWLEIPVVLLSATLPSSRKRALLHAYDWTKPLEQMKLTPVYPSLTWLDEKRDVREMEVKGTSIVRDIALSMHPVLGSDWEGVIRLADSDLAHGGCLVVILNTVNEAQNCFLAMENAIRQGSLAGAELMLFHGRFTVHDRNHKEAACLHAFDKSSLLSDADPAYHKRPTKCILVATQVVEQSLDLDFDVMYSAIAPIDLLLQRLGRLHRHIRPFRPTGVTPVFRVLLPEQGDNYGPSEYVYDPYILNKSHHLLQNRKHILIPEDVKPLVEQLYEGTADDLPEWESSRLKMEAKQEQGRAEGRTYLFHEPKSAGDFGLFQQMSNGAALAANDEEGMSFFHSQTRLGSQTKQVLVMDESHLDTAEFLSHPTKDHAKEMMQCMVSLPGHWMRGMMPQLDYHEVLEIKEGRLAHQQVLYMKNGVWKGIDGKGGTITVRYDERLGAYKDKEGDDPHA